MTCTKKFESVRCIVRVDQLDIRDVTYNRGRCEAPRAVTDVDVRNVAEFIQTLRSMAESNGGDPDGIERALLDQKGMPRRDMATPSRLSKMRSELVNEIGVQESVADRYIDSFGAIGNDPRGVYVFGDRIDMPIKACNLIEMELHTGDGKVWTLKWF